MVTVTGWYLASYVTVLDDPNVGEGLCGSTWSENVLNLGVDSSSSLYVDINPISLCVLRMNVADEVTTLKNLGAV